MKKGVLRLLCVALCLLLLSGTLSVYAADVDTDRLCSLTLTYTKEGVTFEGLEIRLYRVAQMPQVGVFQAVAPFDTYPVALTNVTSQAEWNEIAATLRGYVAADSITPYRVQTTDAAGNAVFTDIEVGLYLVGGVVVETDTAVYTFYDFMMILPAVEEENLHYTVQAYPKSTQSDPIPQPKEYTVLKLWKDNAKPQQRPTAVTVDIFKDGTLAETVVLDAANDWSYTFTCPDGKSVWSVVERDVPTGYTVKITQRETAFVIVNTLDEPDPGSPDTGETFSWYYVILLLCAVGLAAVILGIGLGRNEHATKK